ncbi:hypothetical protein [Streptomyces sp. B21-083]|uniref:hypothetical protein n=1 Tax=Streptomyces sp. B21-083 TaxID=3039410 RepID=UPI002FF221CB
MAAATNVTTGVLTQHWAAAWWAFTVVVVVIGSGLQAWLTFTNDHPAATGGQRIHRTKIGGTAQQSMHGPGEQEITRSTVTGDLSQKQGRRSDAG